MTLDEGLPAHGRRRARAALQVAMADAVGLDTTGEPVLVDGDIAAAAHEAAGNLVGSDGDATESGFRPRRRRRRGRRGNARGLSRPGRRRRDYNFLQEAEAKAKVNYADAEAAYRAPLKLSFAT